MDLEASKRTEKTKAGVKVFIFDCLNHCGNEIRVYKQWANSTSGYCKLCSSARRRKHDWNFSESDVKRIDTVYKGNQKYQIWVLDCSTGCGNEIRIWPGQKSIATGKCSSCVNKKKPFQHVLTNVKQLSKKVPVDLTYDDILEFTKIQKCYYCEAPIEWTPFWSKDSPSHAYYLDRINNSEGYCKDNCVVCCTFCNFVRGNKFTHDEFKLLGPSLKKIRLLRENQTT